MIDKSWIDKPLNSKEFLNGVKQFLDFAFSNSAMKPRDIYDMGEVNLMESQEPIMEDIPFCEQNVGNIEELQLVRDDVNEQENDETNVEEDRNSCSDRDD